MPLSAVDAVVYVAAAAVFLAVVWWVLTRWLPDGSLHGHYALALHSTGITRREAVPAALALALVVVPLATTRGTALGLDWALAAGAYLGGLVVVAVAVANRPRAAAVRDADQTTLPPSGRAVVAGRVAGPADAPPLEAPLSGRPAVSYVASLAEYETQPLKPYGTYFVTAFDVETRPFVVDGKFGEARVDPEDAWVSLLPGAPTSEGRHVEGRLTGGTAETEHVVAAGEPVPKRLRAADAFGDLPLSGEGRAERALRFKESTLGPGDAVVVAGDAQQGESYGETVIRCDAPGGFVAKGDVDSVTAALSKTTGRWLAFGAVLVVVGAGALLWLAIP
jgi:hypothetical protein